jgi:hypothetical protein
LTDDEVAALTAWLEQHPMREEDGGSPANAAAPGSRARRRTVS